VGNDAPATFSKGTTTVTWTVTDASGNTATSTQKVKVEDHENPTITAPADVTVNTDAGQCSAKAANVTLGTPTFDDNCPGSTVNNDAPATFPAGITTVTWTVTDASGNSKTATQTITVEDHQKPKITGTSANISVNNDPGNCSAVVTWTEPKATDN